MAEKLKIKGQKPLKGEVIIGGAKNAVLKLMAASLLNKGECTIYNVPDLTDVNIMLNVLSQLGAKTTYNKDKKYLFSFREKSSIMDILLKKNPHIQIVDRLEDYHV